MINASWHRTQTRTWYSQLCSLCLIHDWMHTLVFLLTFLNLRCKGSFNVFLIFQVLNKEVKLLWSLMFWLAGFAVFWAVEIVYWGVAAVCPDPLLRQIQQVSNDFMIIHLLDLLAVVHRPSPLAGSTSSVNDHLVGNQFWALIIDKLID